MTRRTRLLMCALVVVALSVEGMFASDPVAVYARVDRVVLEPNTEAPETIQVHGVFSLAQTNNPNDYRPPAMGYLYFALPTDRVAARREWSDLHSVAGTGQLVAFGSRYKSTPRLRQLSERPSNPDTYAINLGVTKVHGRTDYAPIRALLDYKP